MNTLPDKVKAALKKLPPFKRVVVGLSGGMDSVALTHLLDSLGYEVIVAHLNHQLRPTSGVDEQFVMELAQKWGLPLMSQKAVIPQTGNLEATARQMRYSYLEEVRKAYHADVIAVGHHFDDQIETILMHQKRGAGLRGQAGMRLQSGNLIRPMLDVPKTLIEAYVREHQLSYVTDETNSDLRFTRNHLRHKRIPELKKDPLFEEKMRELSLSAQKKVEQLQEESKAWIQKELKGDRFDRPRFNQLENALKIEILLQLLGQQDLYSKTLFRLMDFIAHGKTGKELRFKEKIFILEYGQVRLTTKNQWALSKIPLEDRTRWGRAEQAEDQCRSGHRNGNRYRQ